MPQKIFPLAHDSRKPAALFRIFMFESNYLRNEKTKKEHNNIKFEHKKNGFITVLPVCELPFSHIFLALFFPFPFRVERNMYRPDIFMD